jgi:hypothetical protein
MSKNKIIGRWQISLATTSLGHASTHYIIGLFRKACMSWWYSPYQRKAILPTWWFFTYGHMAQLIIDPRCSSYLIQQNAKLWKLFGHDRVHLSIRRFHGMICNKYIWLGFLRISIFVFWDLDVWII